MELSTRKMFSCSSPMQAKPLATRGRGRSPIWYLFLVAATIAVGLATRRFPEFVPGFLGKYPGDALWALMVFFAWGIVFPATSSVRLGALALTVSSAVEILKLYQAPWLVNLRQNTLGHLVFGHTFTWQNFIAYAVGVVLGVVGEYLPGWARRRKGSSMKCRSFLLL